MAGSSHGVLVKHLLAALRDSAARQGQECDRIPYGAANRGPRLQILDCRYSIDTAVAVATQALGCLFFVRASPVASSCLKVMRYSSGGASALPVKWQGTERIWMLLRKY